MAGESVCMARAAHEYRRSIGKCDFTLLQLAVLDFILYSSLERWPARDYAIFPLQKDIAEQRGIDEGDVGKTIKWLCRQKVIEVAGCRYALLPPPWTVPVRVRETQELLAREAWLEGLEEGQPDLLPPEKSLNEARREVFVESSRVESKLVESSGKSQVGESPTKGIAKVGESPSRGLEVGESPSLVDRIDRIDVDPDRLIDSRSVQTRSDPDRSDRPDEGTKLNSVQGVRVGESPSSHRAHVMAELWRVIGQHEKFGRSASHWQKCEERLLDEVDELIGVLKDLERAGRAPSSRAAWMMRCTKNAMLAKGWH